MIASFKVEHATRSSRIGVAAFGLAFVLLAAAPAWGGRDDLRLLSEIYAYVALASLWNLLAGYAGLVSVGQQAYVGLGVYVLSAFGTAMVGALIFLQKLRISPDTAFSINDWTAFVIFITVIGGIGRVEGPIIGTVVFFLLRQTLADLGAIYLLILGVVAIAVMLLAPKGIWGFLAERFGWQLLPLERRLRFGADARTT